MINLNKIDWLALAAMNNALRLHGDAIHLYKDQRYSSAFFLSILSQEEIGKAYIASNFVWHSRVEGRYPQAIEVEVLQLLYKHPFKQGTFLRNSPQFFSLLTTKKGRRKYDGVFEGVLEAEKQNAIYVNLRKQNKKLNPKGHVLQPKVTRIKAEKQISLVNDYLLEACIGHIIGTQELDISDIRRVLNRKLLKELMRDWHKRSPEINSLLLRARKSASENKLRPF